MIIPFPASIKIKVVSLLLNRYPPCPRFLFEEPEGSGQCSIQTSSIDYPDYGPWLSDRVADILATGLTDGDGEDAWFRYKGVLISYKEGKSYWYIVYDENHEDEDGFNEAREFDVRDLTPVMRSDGEADHELTIRAAIDSGQLPYEIALYDLS